MIDLLGEGEFQDNITFWLLYGYCSLLLGKFMQGKKCRRNIEKNDLKVW